MNYLDIANSSFVFMVCGIVIAAVLVICCIFLIWAWRRGLELGMSREIMVRTIKTSMTFSIAPSIPIVIALTSHGGCLGHSLPLAAIIHHRFISVRINDRPNRSHLHGHFSSRRQRLYRPGIFQLHVGHVFGNYLGDAVLHPVSQTFFLRTYQCTEKGLHPHRNHYHRSLFRNAVRVVGPPIVSGGIQLYTLVVSALLMVIITQLTRRKESAGDYAFTLSMVGGMVFDCPVGQFVIGGVGYETNQQFVHPRYRPHCLQCSFAFDSDGSLKHMLEV
jgi:Flp pilus assembly protein protease CpaA